MAPKSIPTQLHTVVNILFDNQPDFRESGVIRRCCRISLSFT